MRRDYFRILSWCRRSKIEHIYLFFSICPKKILLICLFLFLVTKLYLTLCDPVDCSPPGSSAHGILQARILEWVAMPSSRGSSKPRDLSHVSYVSCNGRWKWHLVGLCWINSYFTNCISSVCLQYLVPNKCGFQENKDVYYFFSQSLHPPCLLALYRAPVSIYFKSI